MKKVILALSVLILVACPAYSISESAKAIIEQLRNQTKAEEVASGPVVIPVISQAEKTPEPVSGIDLKPDFTTIEAQRQYELLMGIKNIDLAHAKEAAHYAKEGSPSYLKAVTNCLISRNTIMQHILHEILENIGQPSLVFSGFPA